MKSIENLESIIMDISSNIFCGLREQIFPAEKDFDDLFRFMKELNSLTRSQDFVSKELAGVYFDLSTAIYSAVDTSGEKADWLMNMFDKFCDIARDYFSVEG